MKYAMVAAFAAGVSAGMYETMPVHGNGTSYVTEVVSKYTTYCPSPTSIVHGSSTYTVTEATTLTITDCPCTVTYPVKTSTTSVCYTCPATTPAAPVKPSEKPTYSYEAPTEEAPTEYPTEKPTEAPTYPAPPAPPVSAGPTYAPGNGTKPTYSATEAGPTATYAGAANQVAGQTGFGLAAVLGLVAYIL